MDERIHSRTFAASLRRWRALGATGGTRKQQFALTCIVRERCRALKLPARLAQAAEPDQQVAAHAGQEVIVAQ